MRNNRISLSYFIFLLMPCMQTHGQNVGINTTTPTHARLETSGTVGASAAMFGSDRYGINISADNPEIGFNYFYNGGTNTIKAGYAAFMGMNTFNGDIYIGNFNGNQSLSDFGPISGAREIIHIKQNGYVGIGTVTPAFPLVVRSLLDGSGLVQENTDGSVKVGFWTSTNGAYIQTWTNHPLYFSTGGDYLFPKMSLETNGNLFVSGSVDITDKLTSPTTSVTNLVPIAYGKIKYDGSIMNATYNCNIIKTGTGTYEVSIVGEPNMYANAEKYYVTLTADGGGNPTYIIKGNNSIEVTQWQSFVQTGGGGSCGNNCFASWITNPYAQQKTDNGFNFMVYKFN